MKKVVNMAPKTTTPPTVQDQARAAQAWSTYQNLRTWYTAITAANGNNDAMAKARQDFLLKGGYSPTLSGAPLKTRTQEMNAALEKAGIDPAAAFTAAKLPDGYWTKAFVGIMVDFDNAIKALGPAQTVPAPVAASAAVPTATGTPSGQQAAAPTPGQAPVPSGIAAILGGRAKPPAQVETPPTPAAAPAPTVAPAPTPASAPAPDSTKSTLPPPPPPEDETVAPPSAPPAAPAPTAAPAPAPTAARRGVVQVGFEEGDIIVIGKTSVTVGDMELPYNKATQTVQIDQDNGVVRIMPKTAVAPRTEPTPPAPTTAPPVDNAGAEKPEDVLTSSDSGSESGGSSATPPAGGSA